MPDEHHPQPALHNGATPDAADLPGTDDLLHLHGPGLLAALHQLRQAESMPVLRRLLTELHDQIDTPAGALHAADANPAAAESVLLRAAYLNGALKQIAQTRTLERARYYIDRLIRGVGEERTNGLNDINLNRWQEYEHIHTESLWIEQRRDKSGAHTADYWGNFIPQIPRQMMWRYTRPGEWVLDTFAGYGTTLIEGQRLGRNTLGIELQPNTAARARERVQAEANPAGVQAHVVTGDSTCCDYADLLRQHGQRAVQLVIMHPPYFDIIKFSDHPDDLANARSLDDFLTRMGQVIDNAAQVLAPKRYLVLVIGDKYAAGEWIPLGFRTMQEVQNRGFLLKSIIVKNFEETTGKRNQKALWRYRALLSGFYIFKHEYIFLFQKRT